ncbi:MAG: phosphoenolpyruvate mutase [Thermodesulfobacteriota bacterium]|nr:phosphoenolpyruvate mutase [Thermodesulfobacteriota bacterium]
MKKTKLLRDLILQKRIVRLIGAHDGLTAKLGENQGFDGIWASGLEISTSYCVPDANILTMSQYLERTCEINDAVAIPVMADCDTGYGNSNNVIYMVKKYEAAGIAAICIEDKKFPKTNSFIPGKQELASVAEFVGKIMAAKSAQTDPDFMVVARVEALIAGYGMDEALMRAKAYHEAGADAILIHSKKKTPDEVLEFARRWGNRLPLVVVPTSYYEVSAEELADSGISVVVYANHGIRASVKAIESIYGEILRTGSTKSVEGKITTMKYIFELQGMPKMKEDEKQFLHGDREKTIAVIAAAGDHLEEHSMNKIASEIPISMLDINGKPLLQRQAETLHKSEISEIFVVTGYKRELIDVDGVRLLENTDYKNTGILHSVMQAGKHMDSKAVISYGDIYFENVILELLLKSPEDITILADSGYDSKDYAQDKLLDLVITDSAPVKAKRKLHEASVKRVKQIGMKIDRDQAHFEFPGLLVLSKKGAKIFRGIYDVSAKKYAGKPFHEAPVFERAGLADLLQEIIDLGHPVACIEVNSGWMELHSFENYKLACLLIK